MAGNRCCVSVLLICGLAALATPDGLTRAQGKEAHGVEPRLEGLLQRLDRVASLYRDNALNFSCREKLAYYPGTPAIRAYDLEYIYVYDEAKGLLDYRNEVGRKRKDGSPRQIPLSDLNLPSVLQRAYSWIFIFQRSLRDSYRYTLLGEEKVLGRRATVIRFDAIPPYLADYNDWFGRAWVDSETSQLLKIEALKADYHEVQERMHAELQGVSEDEEQDDHDYVIEEVVTEFSVEHNGMRFPGSVIIRRYLDEIKERHGERTVEERPIFRIEQTYSDYRFYAVRTQEQIRDIVSGEAESEGRR